MTITLWTLKQQMNDISFLTMRNFQLGYAGVIQFSNIICNDSSLLSNLKTLVSIGLFTSYQYHFKRASSGDVLFFYSHEYIARNDHLKLFMRAANCIGNKTVVIGKRKERRFTLNNLKNIVLMPIWLYQMHRIKVGFFRKIALLAYVASMAVWVEYLKKNDDKLRRHNVLITLFDANKYENIIVQYFKMYNIPTATLQHGHFNATVAEADDKNLIGLAFEGFVSDKFLAWGEYTKNEAIKNGIEAQRIVCVGCPKYIGYRHGVAKGPADVFGVVLDGGGKYSEAANIEMLHIANAVAQGRGMRYVIKPHPISDISVFDSYICKDFLERICEKSESVEAYADSVSFSLVMGSSVYAELLYIKANVFRYISAQGIDRYEQIKWGSFKTTEELLELYNLLGKKPEYMAEMNQMASDMLCEPGDIGRNYRWVIEEIARGNTVV